MIYLIIGYFISNAALLLVIANDLYKANSKIDKLLPKKKMYIGCEDTLENLNKPVTTRYGSIQGS